MSGTDVDRSPAAVLVNAHLALMRATTTAATKRASAVLDGCCQMMSSYEGNHVTEVAYRVAVLEAWRVHCPSMPEQGYGSAMVTLDWKLGLIETTARLIAEHSAVLR